MKQLLLLLYCFLALDPVFSQKYDYVWLSGVYNLADDSATNFIVDFKTFPPVVDKIDSKTLMIDANISMSDKDGELAFYTNMCKVKNSEHETLYNGEGLSLGPFHDFYCGVSGTYNLPQGVFALPGTDQAYDLFHLRGLIDPPGPNFVCWRGALLHSRIDMNAQQGKGAVVFKDSVLLEACLQTACANRHANGRDWWILAADNTDNRFYRFLSTPNGIEGPWIQDINNPTTQDTFFYLGWSEFSPDGEYFLVYDVHSGAAVYAFDRCTGLLSSLWNLPGDPDSYGWSAAFSPDSRFVYIVRDHFSSIRQFDLHAADITASQTTVAVWDSFFFYQQGSGGPRQTFFNYFQHGPDGKLYNWAGDTKYMHVMNFPNRKGTQCDLVQRAVELPYYTIGANAYYPNYRLGPVDGSACDSLGIDNLPVALFRHDVEDTLAPLAVTFTDLSYYAPTAWHWDFGDGGASQDTSPVHVFPAAGTYNVCLTVSNAFASDTFCRMVQVGTVGLSELLPVLPRAQVSPNPCGDLLRVSLPAMTGENPVFVLFDLFGRPLVTQTLTGFDTPIDTKRLPAGMYGWQMRYRGVVAQAGKVVKR
jgi:hypothetical protein